MNWLELPLMAEGFLDVRVAAAVCILATQWLKHYLPDWRYTNLLALGITVGVELLATAVCTAASVSGAGAWFAAAWAGVLGASLATFGYEALANLAGRAGVGPRAEG